MDNKIKDISEKELIKRCIADEREYQEILYRKYADKMYSIALTYSNNEDDACDILQDGFIKVFRNLNSFRFDCPFEAWVRKIIINTALQLYNKKKREQEVFEDYGTITPAPLVDGVLDKISASEIITMVNQLPTKAAMVLKLYAIEGYGHREIAELMGVSEGTSKSQLNRARFLLKELMNKLNG